MCPSKDVLHLTRWKVPRRILAQCIKRLGEWMRYPSYRSPDYSLLFIGSSCRFSNSHTPHGVPGQSGENNPQSRCVKGQEER